MWQKIHNPLLPRKLAKTAFHPARLAAYVKNGNEEKRRLTKDERDEVAGALEYVRANFQKRLETYLKKYGVSKLHTWTYWADR